MTNFFTLYDTNVLLFSLKNGCMLVAKLKVINLRANQCWGLSHKLYAVTDNGAIGEGSDVVIS